MKKIEDYKGILPYASELLGIYQPLLGWKSKLISERYKGFRSTLYKNIATRLLQTNQSLVQPNLQVRQLALMSHAEGGGHAIGDLQPINCSKTTEGYVSSTIDSGAARLLSRELGEKVPSNWIQIVNAKHMSELLQQLKEIFTQEEISTQHSEIQEYLQSQ